MMKKVFSLLLTMAALVAADEILIRVDLEVSRLAPLADQGLKIIAEFENSAIVLHEKNDLQTISSLDFQILDTQPQGEQYYVARPMERNTDLTPFGDVLTQDGPDYLIRLHPGMLESLLDHKVMVRRLSLRPMVLRTAAAFPQVRYDQMVQNIVNLVDPDSVLAKVQRLQDFRTRLSTHDSCMAAAN